MLAGPTIRSVARFVHGVNRATDRYKPSPSHPYFPTRASLGELSIAVTNARRFGAYLCHPWVANPTVGGVAVAWRRKKVGFADGL